MFSSSGQYRYRPPQATLPLRNQGYHIITNCLSCKEKGEGNLVEAEAGFTCGYSRIKKALFRIAGQGFMLIGFYY